MYPAAFDLKFVKLHEEGYGDGEIDKFFNCLKLDKALPKEVVSEIRKRIYSASAKKSLRKYDPQAAEVFNVAEVDASKRLAHFNIKEKGLYKRAGRSLIKMVSIFTLRNFSIGYMRTIYFLMWRWSASV